jgi:membrane protein
MAGGFQEEASAFWNKVRTMTRSDVTQMLGSTISEWQSDNAQRLSAALTFYALLSIAPLGVILVSIAAAVYGKQAAEGQLAAHIANFIGPQNAQTIQNLIERSYRPAAGILAGILGLLILFWGASSVVVELRQSLNTIWHVNTQTTEGLLQGVFSMLKERFYSAAIVVGGGIILLASVAVSAGVTAAAKMLGPAFPAPAVLVRAVTFVISFLVVAFVFAAIYKLLPDVQLKWTDVIIGACFTALLITIGRELIAIYLGRMSVTSTYGAAGSLVLILIWVYYSALFFFFGAEFTKIYARRFGSLCPAPPNAPQESQTRAEPGAPSAGERSKVSPAA